MGATLHPAVLVHRSVHVPPPNGSEPRIGRSAARNRTRSSRHATVGRPGDGICPRYNCTSRCRSFIVAIINPSIIEGLRRPVESGQYTAWAFSQRVRSEGLVHSLGTVGDAFDNAVVDSLWGRMQTELLNRKKWSTRLDLSIAMFDWIEAFCNPTRRHSPLGNISPAEFERRHHDTTTAA